MATIAQSHPLNILSFNDTTGTLILQSAAGNSNDMLHFRDKLNSTIAKVDVSGAMFTTTATAGTNTTQVATTEFVKTAIDNLIASAPGTLDTLNEIAAALQNNPDIISDSSAYALMGVI